MPSNAQEYLTEFLQGQEFYAPAKGVITNGKPDKGELQILSSALKTETPKVRKQIVLLLVDVGRQVDALKPRGADVIRDPDVLLFLARDGLARPDMGREAAMDALRKLATQHDLERFGEFFADALHESPTYDGFLLIAKSKYVKARAIVNSVEAGPGWDNVMAARAARAALGESEIEDEFIKSLGAAKTGPEVVTALQPLAVTGTPRCLKAVALLLRTVLTVDVSGVHEKSVRLNALDALRYNYPDHPELYPNNIHRESDYTEAERFCTKTFGVSYTTPPPKFLTYRGYPTPMPR